MSDLIGEHYRVTILGCGSSGGVPRANGDWGICDPNEPKNTRLRCSLLVDYWQGERGAALPPAQERTTVLIDTSPDLRAQLLQTQTRRLDAVLLTHDHADQTHGIDDLRAIAYSMRRLIPTHMDAPTFDSIDNKFGYCFATPDGRDHPPILEHQTLLEDKKPLTIKGKGGDIKFIPLLLSHGSGPSLGFRFGPVSYAPDVVEIGDATLEAMTGTDTLIIDSLRYHQHPTHAHADRALMWAARCQARQTVMTNLHIDMDYSTLKAELPPACTPAYDFMQLNLFIK